MPLFRRLLGLLLGALCVVLMVERSAAAAPRHSPSRKVGEASAERSAEQARSAAATALAAGDVEAARRLASESLQLEPAPEALFLLGQIALREQRQLDAQDLMARYLADPNLESSADSAEQREAQRTVALPPLASCNLLVLGDRDSLLYVDERLVGVLPLALPLLLSPAEHKIELRQGKRHQEDRVRVPVGRLGELRADLSTGAMLLSLPPAVLTRERFIGTPPEVQQRLLSFIAAGIRGAHLSPISERLAFELAGEPAPGACADELRCLRSLAQSVEAELVLSARVETSAQGTELQLELLDVGSGEVAAAETLRLAVDPSATPAAKLAESIGRLYKRASERPRGQVEILSSPSGAEVFLDGALLGVTPLRTASFADKERRLRLHLSDYRDDEQPLALQPGGTTKVERVLEPLPEPAPPALAPTVEMVWKRQPRPLARLVIGPLVMGLGLLTMGVGASGVLLDGQCELGTVEGSTCTARYHTMGNGQVLLSGGLLLLGAGVVILAVPGKKRLVAK